MSKEYFPHDYAARLSLRDVRKDFGMVGVGVYWCIVEILHEEGGYIKENDLAGVAYDLQVELDLCHAITHNYDLFSIKKGKIFSERVLRNINKREEISLARSKAATARWDCARNSSKNVSKDTEKSEFKIYDQKFDASKSRLFACLDRWSSEEESTDPFATSPAEAVRHTVDNLIQNFEANFLIINGKEVTTVDWVEAIANCVNDKKHRYDLYTIIYEVEEKQRKAEIRHSRNYLISALYNTAKAAF